MTKKEIRNKLNKKRNSLTAKEIEELSIRIFENLKKLKVFENDKIFSFVSTKSEVSMNFIMKYCFENDISIAVPKVYGDIMHFHKITSEEDLSEGAYGIWEPNEKLDILIPDEKSVVFMPGLAFDLKGARIGYGGGFYDKYFEVHNEGLKVAVCFEFQVIKDLQLPKNENDISPDIIVTDKDVYYIS